MNNKKLTTIATLGSHSALEVCRGAQRVGLPSLVVTEQGREKTYAQYFRRKDGEGCVDDVINLKKFDQILNKDIQDQLQAKNAVFVPNRSFEVYLHNNYDAIENKFSVPMFGNKYLLKIEERAADLNQYHLLQKAGIRAPRTFSKAADINCLCIIKAQQKERSYERAFFFASSPEEYEKNYAQQLQSGLLDEKEPLRIEEYLIGVQVNLNFFYSPLKNRLELLGTDTRRQTNVSGFASLPAASQLLLPETTAVSFEEAGHIAVTILESMLEPAFELGERFVKAAKEFHPRGIIGPFSLQSMIIPTGKKKEFAVFDVSPRMPGSPGIEATPYSAYLYGNSVSMGQRIAMEIKEAMKENALAEVTT